MYVEEFDNGRVEIEQPSASGLRCCKCDGEIIGIIRSNPKGGHEIVVKQGKPRPGKFKTLWLAASVLLGSYRYHEKQGDLQPIQQGLDL